ncbi:hypothetical protein CEW87_19260 [Parazoarcus communis]|uniref:EamA domain-containing protein n=1 Tax=Parazoarcus communis TaxID=41977 RepID=A0A2U8H6M8_9RHOO|nr:DMT family transporter [Parazoarcus communis]AWI81318.1 hypothetical protein CEW87_19260 [Parazoarcus communis]
MNTDVSCPSPLPAIAIEAAPEQPASRPAEGVSLWVYVKLVMVALFWGGTFIAGRVLAQEMPLMAAATGRFAIAVVLLLLVAWKFEGGLPRLRGSQVLVTAALGFTGIFLYNVCFLAALSHMPAGRTALLVALNPIATAVFASLLFHERLGRIKWLGFGIAFVGAAVVITRGELLTVAYDFGRSIGKGETLMFIAVMNWAAYTLIGRKALKDLSPIAATTYAAMWGLVFLSVGAVWEFRPSDWHTFGWEVWGSMVYLGVFGTVVGFVWYYEGIKAIGASRAAVFTNLVPAFGVILGALVLGETILISMVVGGALAAIGVTLANRART